MNRKKKENITVLLTANRDELEILRAHSETTKQKRVLQLS